NALPGYASATWSLAIEEQFYLLLPLLVLSIRTDRLPRYLLPAIIGCPVIRAGVLWLFPKNGIVACYVLLPCRWDSLLLGTLAAWMVRTPDWKERLRDNLPALQKALLVLAAGYAVLAVTQGFGTRIVTLA